MRTIRRMLCALRGHAWETTEDPFGAVTTCARCGALRHVPGDGSPEPDIIFGKGDPSGGE